MTNAIENPTFGDEVLKPSPKALKKKGDRIGQNHVVLKSLKKSPKNDVVKCFYMKSLFNFGVCVIKEGSINDSVDRFGRDIKQRLQWQQQLHQTIGQRVRAPKLIVFFEQEGKCYLAIEHIGGRSLASYLKEHGPEVRRGLTAGSSYGLKFAGYLVQCASILGDLHTLNIVHRDATAANYMISKSGKVYL